MSRVRSTNKEMMESIRSFIDEFTFDNHRSPYTSEIATAIGIAKSSAYRYLVDMSRIGMIEYDGKSISTPNTRKSFLEMNRVPVIGQVVCGTPELAEECFEEYVPLPVSLFGKGDYFILRTYRDSMTEVGIDDGDMVVVKKQNNANPGDIVVALVQNETTLKTYYPEPENKRVRLHPENSSMKDILVKECSIQGVAQYVIKKL